VKSDSTREGTVIHDATPRFLLLCMFMVYILITDLIERTGSDSLGLDF
jgi:hypothetical protein